MARLPIATKRGRGRPPHPGVLTPAEERVHELLREGLMNAEIAVRLGVSPDAVKYHISNMLSKAGLAGRDELARWRPEQQQESRGARRLSWAGIPLAAKLFGAGTIAVAVGGGIYIAGIAPSLQDDDAGYVTGIISRGHDGSPADGNSRHVSLSEDGRFVAFDSDATNLVPGDTNGHADVFLFDRASNTMRLISQLADGTAGNGPSRNPEISANGRYIVFESEASNLAAGDSNGSAEMPPPANTGGDDSAIKLQAPPTGTDVFLKDLQTGAIERISVNDAGTGADSRSFGATITGDGRFVVFASGASNLGPTASSGPAGAWNAIFLRDRTAGTTRRIDVAADGTPANNSSAVARISPDGRYVVFSSLADNLVPGVTPTLQESITQGTDGSQVGRRSAGVHYVHDRDAGMLSALPLPPGALFATVQQVADGGIVIMQVVLDPESEAGKALGGAAIYKLTIATGEFIGFRGSGVPGRTSITAINSRGSTVVYNDYEASRNYGVSVLNLVTGATDYFEVASERHTAENTRAIEAAISGDGRVIATAIVGEVERTTATGMFKDLVSALPGIDLEDDTVPLFDIFVWEAED